MRNLDFIANGQTLRRDPMCDFSGIVAGTRGYLRARFRFSAEWAGCKKAAVFICKGKGIPVPIVDNACEIPAEALDTSAVRFYVVGRRGGSQITTSMVAFPQTVHR